MKGMYNYVKKAWQKPNMEVLRQRMFNWRQSDAVVKVDKPLRLDRARTLGYKAKKGFVVARVRVVRGGRTKMRPKHGRRSKRMTSHKILKMNYQWVAEMRAAQKYDNLEVLNSYNLGKDGQHFFYEVILVDPEMPEIKSDKTINWICSPKNRGRVFRGLTSAGKKSRGLSTKSREMKVRPSLRANNRRGK